MSRSYSEDLRQRIVNAVDGGISRRQAAEHYNVSVSSAIRYARRWRETGSVQAAAMGAPRRSKLDPHADWLLAQIDEAPDLTLEEIIARLGSERGVKSSIGGLWNFFHRHAISFKKTAHAAEQDRPDVAENRRVWRARQPALDPTRLVFIDETGANTKMARLRGRCRRGQRLVAAVPHGHWKTMTFIAGLRHDGITAPFVVDRPMNGVIFRLWVERCLVPTLAHGDIVVMDNLASHKIAGVREAIEAAGAKLAYLPAYSPDFNPIEQFFAKLKAMLRKAAVRTIDELWRAIGDIINTVTPNECVNYFANSGYEPN